MYAAGISADTMRSQAVALAEERVLHLHPPIDVLTLLVETRCMYEAWRDAPNGGDSLKASDVSLEKCEYKQRLRRSSRQREQRAGEDRTQKRKVRGGVRIGGTIGKDDSLTS